MEIKINSLDDIEGAAKQFLAQMGESKIFAFYGGMGAGKTTFIKALCQQMGVTDVVNSPSFAIINEYTLPQTGGSIYHFDVYRIKKISEVYDIGYEDYFFSGNLNFIEWPELIEDLLPEDTVRLQIDVLPDHTRLLHTR